MQNKHKISLQTVRCCDKLAQRSLSPKIRQSKIESKTRLLFSSVECNREAREPAPTLPPLLTPHTSNPIKAQPPLNTPRLGPGHLIQSRPSSRGTHFHTLSTTLHM